MLNASFKFSKFSSFRHDRVKRWTRKVNIFEKDFIVIPINENYHWYLAIICFPGQVLRIELIQNILL